MLMCAGACVCACVRVCAQNSLYGQLIMITQSGGYSNGVCPARLGTRVLNTAQYRKQAGAQRHPPVKMTVGNWGENNLKQDITFHIIFIVFFGPFHRCLTFVFFFFLPAEGDFPENLHRVVYVIINKRSFESFMCLDLSGELGQGVAGRTAVRGFHSPDCSVSVDWSADIGQLSD